MTQTRKEALTELLEKVAAGGGRLVLPDFKDALNTFPKHGAANAWDAYHGSIDAAKALHESVLPGWTMDQMNEWHANGESAGWHVCLLKYSEPQLRARAGEFDMSPARAWLIAILNALIAQEPDQ